MSTSLLKILYEDEEILVFTKPVGMPSVPHSSDEIGTAVNAALAYYPSFAGIGRGGLEPGILHRLDTLTSGAILFAKTEHAYRRLTELWKNRKIDKVYRALVSPSTPDQKPLQVPLLISWPIGASRKSSKRQIAATGSFFFREIRGKPQEAITWIDEMNPHGNAQDLTIRIETGVRHQIRCHLSATGWPIIGDSLYKGQASSRLWLHAWKIGIPSPDGQKLWIESPLPEDWG